ncbi:MAG: MFS transporter [Spirochaetales bacterium]|nr:MFS transporter [Spirochaetales bacterium]
MKEFLNRVEDPRIRRALTYSIIDGILWAVMFGFAENYVIPFALFFGASAFQVSILQGSMQFSISIGQIAGASFIQKFKKRRILSIICNAAHSLSYLIIVYGTVITKNPLVALAAYALGTLSTHLGGPGWTSWMNDIVPKTSRGRYYSIRNRMITIFQFFTIILAGILLYFGEIYGFEELFYIFLFTAGSLSRLSSIYPLYKQYEPAMTIPKAPSEFKYIIFLKKIGSTNFGRFAGFSFLLTFAVNIMAPVVPVFLLKSLHFNYLQFMIIMMSSMFSTFLALRYWGNLSDTYGNYKILFVTAISLPIIIVGWVFIKNFYLLILLQLFSGFVWSGLNLSTQNFLFDSVKPQNIPKVSAYFTATNNIFAFLGSITGGILTLVITQIKIPIFAENNYELIFALSGLIRAFIIIFMIRRFAEVRDVEPSPDFRYFYVYKPMSNIINRIQIIKRRLKKNEKN